MSNLGQAVLAIGGAVVGFAIGGPAGAQVGFTLGVAAGSVVFPTQLPGTFGPRLTSKATTTSALGDPVMQVFGTDVVPGTVIYLGAVKETATTQSSGKGGPEQDNTTFTYQQSIGIGLCRGPMGGILRIWENGKLVYDPRPRQEGETTTAFNNRLTAAAAYAAKFVLYLGDEEQLPDPTIELDKGVGTTPAFRGLMYIMYPDRQLKSDQALRHPTFKFEVFSLGAFVCDEVQTHYAQEVLDPWVEASDPRNPRNLHTYHFFGTPIDDPAGEHSLGFLLDTFAAYKGVPYSTRMGYGIANTELGGFLVDTLGGPTVGSYDGPIVYFHYNRHAPDTVNLPGTYDYSIRGAPNDPGKYTYDDTYSLSLTLAIPGSTSSPVPNPPTDFWDLATRYPAGTDAHWWEYSQDLVIKVRRVPRPPDDPCEGLPSAPGLPGYCYVDGLLVKGGAWEKDTGQLFNVLQLYQPDWSPPYGTGTKYPLGPVLPQSDPRNTEAFWTAAYDAAVVAGTMAAGKVYSTDYPAAQNYAYKRDVLVCPCEEVTEYSNEQLLPWGDFDSLDPRRSGGVYQYRLHSNPLVDTLGEALAYASPALRDEILCWSCVTGDTGDGARPYRAPSPDNIFDPERELLFLHFNESSFGVKSEDAWDTAHETSAAFNLRQTAHPFWWTGKLLPAGNPDNPHGVYFADGSRTDDVGIEVRRLTTPPPRPCTLGTPSTIPGYCVDADGNLMADTDWEFVNSGTWKALAKYTVGPNAHGVSTVTQYPLPTILPSTDPKYDDAGFWTAAYNAAVLAGKMPAGLVYNVDYPSIQSFGYRRTFTRCTVSTSKVPLSAIIAGIAAQVPPLGDFVDVADLTTTLVNGYTISTICDARSAITPLVPIAPFDSVESNGLLRFVKRGGAPVRTILETDLGARDASSTPGPAITVNETQDVDLPRKVKISYFAPARDYQPGLAQSPNRLITQAVNDTTVEVPVALDDDQANQIAEIAWAQAWAGRWQYAIQLDQYHADLEPTDVLLVPVDGRLERMRILTAPTEGGILKNLTLCGDDDGAYVSTAIAPASHFPVSSVTLLKQTVLLLLDLPPLRVGDNDAGFYGAVRAAAGGNSWSGATIYRSDDNGGTFGAGVGISTQAPIGTTTNALPAGPTDGSFDDSNTISIILLSGTLESHSDADLDAGANTIALGLDGRWEVLQFGTATQTGDTTWDLTHLRRGRRGTEYLVGTGEIGDTFVVVSGDGIIRLPLANTAIGQPLIYRAVTLGAAFSTGADVPATSHGQTLVPFAPIDLAGSRDLSENLTITWIRRDRFGQELGAGPPMSEATESYVVHIIGGSPEGIIRTLTSSTPSVEYLATDQTTDGLGPTGSPLPEISVTVQQVSAVVGPGIAAAAVL